MGRRLTHRQLNALSQSIGLLYRSCELDAFPRHVFAAVTPLVRCDFFSYNEFDGHGTLKVVHCEPGLPAAASEFLTAIGPNFSKEHPTVSHVSRTGAPQPFKITDFTSQRQWRQTRLYNEFYGPLACEYQMAFASPLPEGQVALAFNSARRDYSEEDRQLLELLRPHLMQAHANAQILTRLTSALHGTNAAVLTIAPDGSITYATHEALHHVERYFGSSSAATTPRTRLRQWLSRLATTPHTPPLVIEQEDSSLRVTLVNRERDGTSNLLLEVKRDADAAKELIALGLTPREAEVLIWVSRGKTTGEIGIILDAKPATVSKHLDHIYQKLGVDNRTAAAAYVT